MKFYDNTEKKFGKLLNRFNNDINDQNIYMKNNIEAIHDECITKISENYTKLKSILSEAVNYKIEASDCVDEKIREKILDFQQKTAIILSDVCECKEKRKKKKNLY
jgi:hypothetical protein